ncbi:MAG: hypothetical protein WC655_18095 [Candidatus Hydrogenedentales bacterium]|jgi:prepilin-type processing-associated H-X9-DG protein
MSETHDANERSRRVREYLLGTGTLEEMEEVHRLIAESPDWQQALAREQQGLDILDCLQPERSVRDLSATVMARLEELPGDQERPVPLRRYFSQFAAVVATVLILAAIVLPALSRMRVTPNRASSANNLKQLGIVFKIYANASKGEVYPPLAPYEGVWMFDLSTVYPVYLTDLSILVDPSLPDASKLVEELNRLANTEPIDWEAMTRIAARSYTYTGYAANSEADIRAIADNRRLLASAEIAHDVHANGNTVYRLREGIERFFLSDINNPAATAAAQASIPVLVETRGPRKSSDMPAGYNVLYMDGHVSLIRQNEAFPIQDKVQELLGQPK